MTSKLNDLHGNNIDRTGFRRFFTRFDGFGILGFQSIKSFLFSVLNKTDLPSFLDMRKYSGANSAQ